MVCVLGLGMVGCKFLNNVEMKMSLEGMEFFVFSVIINLSVGGNFYYNGFFIDLCCNDDGFICINDFFCCLYIFINIYVNVIIKYNWIGGYYMILLIYILFIGVIDIVSLLI